MAELLGRVEQLNAISGGRQQIAGQAQVKTKRTIQLKKIYFYKFRLYLMM
jgi:hypothetical protein